MMQGALFQLMCISSRCLERGYAVCHSECFRIRGRQSYYCARNTTRLAQVACEKQHSGSLRVHEAECERCFEIFSKAV